MSIGRKYSQFACELNSFHFSSTIFGTFSGKLYTKYRPFFEQAMKIKWDNSKIGIRDSCSVWNIIIFKKKIGVCFNTYKFRPEIINIPIIPILLKGRKERDKKKEGKSICVMLMPAFHVQHTAHSPFLVRFYLHFVQYQNKFLNTLIL